MSEPLKIGLIAEGPTDFEVIQAALKAILPDPFIMTLLQPEATQPRHLNQPQRQQSLDILGPICSPQLSQCWTHYRP